MHPITNSLTAVHTALDGAGDAQAIYLDLAAKKEALREVVRAESRLTAMKMSLLAAAGDVADQSAYKTPGTWLADDQNLDPSKATAQQNMAQRLERRIRTATALATGTLNAQQADVITKVLEEIADELDTEQRIAAEETLITEAKELDPPQLRALGRRLVDILNPEKADEREAKRLDDEEKHAEQKSRFNLKKLGDGTTRITGRVPDAVGQRLRTYLESFASPRKQALEADGKALPRPRLLAKALRDLLERIDPNQLPFHGGAPTTVMVTITLDQLRKELATADIIYDDQDLAMTAGQIRRLLCEAEVLPVILNGASQPLDVGRTQRFHNVVQRRLICLRDKTCKAKGCHVPSVWCHIHHEIPWAAGGSTSVKQGMPLCPHHHTIVHDPAYHHEKNSNGDILFHKRT
ncbi:MAG: HNH endonuclease [Nocardioides sp.]|nr:HNH endonuclease [Nocardioides sp.]MDN5892417.1 HNH endonuclease [Nocardioides sp.]